MNSDSIKLTLIQWLSTIEDKNLLQSLLMYKSMQENADWWDSLTKDQVSSIEKGLADAKSGKVISSKKVCEKYGRKPKS
jgi:hypothetical protein